MGDARQLGEHLAQLLDLRGGEVLLEQRADRRRVPAGGVGELLAAAVGELCVGDAEIGVAGRALDEPDGVRRSRRARSTRFMRWSGADESTSRASKSLIVRPCSVSRVALSSRVVTAWARSSMANARTAGLDSISSSAVITA